MSIFPVLCSLPSSTLGWETSSYNGSNVNAQFLFGLKVTRGTDSTKINRPGHNIRMHWTNFRQPTAHVQHNIFGKTSIEACSPDLYASFGTF